MKHHACPRPVRFGRLHFHSATGIRAVLTALVLGAVTTRGATEPNVPVETTAQRDARMEWWREARFGMFVHWGVYS